MTRSSARYGRLAVGVVVLTGTVLAQMPPTLRVVGLVVNGTDLRRRTTPLVVTTATVRVRPFGVANLFGAAPPDRYRLGEIRWTNRSTGWRTYPGTSREIRYTFQDQRTKGRRIIYYQVRSTNPRTGVITYSNIVSATLDFRAPPDPRRVAPVAGYSVSAVDVYRFARRSGFTFTANPAALCRIYPQTTNAPHPSLVLEALPLSVAQALLPPPRCDFRLFGARRLNTGWRADQWRSDPCNCTSVWNMRPSGDSPFTRILVNTSPLAIFQVRLTRLSLFGPTGADWHDAFRR